MLKLLLKTNSQLKFLSQIVNDKGGLCLQAPMLSATQGRIRAAQHCVHVTTSHLSDGSRLMMAVKMAPPAQLQWTCCRYTHHQDLSEQLRCMWESYILTKQTSAVCQVPPESVLDVEIAHAKPWKLSHWHVRENLEIKKTAEMAFV